MGWDDDLGVAGADGAGPGSGPGRQAFAEEQLLTETRIPVPAVCVEDPERGPPARRTAPPPSDAAPGAAGLSRTSQAGWPPRAAASTGSKASARSSQATIAPLAWASAASRSASVVRPLERSPRSERPIPRGRPPGPRMASRAGKPVE